MKANYNEWFYKYNQYIATKDRSSVIKDYNDTSWVNIMTRIKQLESVGDSLVTQPLGVAGTERGFSHLLDLMVKSNYSFNDIDDSLMEAYKKTLQASMSNMMVNSHAVILSCKSNDKRYVSYDQQSRYHIITVPYAQMHFGDRDEFIRQKLPLIHTKANRHFIPLQEFVSKEIDQILGFSLMVSVNGYICNDCMFAIDEQGFQFKVMWTDGFSDNGKDYLEFIIYKLDTVRTHFIDVNKLSTMTFSRLSDYIINGWTLSLDKLGIDSSYFKNGERSKCIVDIYSPQYLRNGRSAPVFGMLDRDGLHVETYGKAATDFQQTFVNTSECILIIYELKYLHEIPNIYPATNYMDMIDDRRVYTERSEGIVDYNDLKIVSEANFDSRSIPICTPPIAIDRDSSSHFQVLTRCLDIEKALKRLKETVLEVGNAIMYKTYTEQQVVSQYRELVAIPLFNIVASMTTEYAAYLQGALLTSRIPRRNINRFRDVIEELTAFANDTPNHIADHLTKMNIYNDYRYDEFVNFIIQPFKAENISIFKDIATVKPSNWYKSAKNPALNDNETPHRFLRPVSEQCFITLKWNYDKKCWLFAAPTISHFKGIGNTFYIDQGLKGDEVFKFFVLYTDTDAPQALEVDPLTLEQAYDFDKFYDEVSKHEGYIKYWNAENKLMKLSKILYDKYDDESVVQVLSKILQGSIEADDILNVYGSQLKYDYPGKTSLTYNPKTDKSVYDPLTDDAAPFTINYLFYTMMMIHENVDNIEALFMRMLVDNKYRKRYIDIDISNAIDQSITLPMNYSRYSIAPIQINSATSHIELGTRVFYGVPLLINNRASSLPNPYRYTFNKYEENRQYPMLTTNGVNREWYLLWEDLSITGASEVTLSHDIQVAKLASKYLTYSYDCINSIETNYVKAYDCRKLIEGYKSSYDLIKNELFDIQSQYTLQSETMDCLNEIIQDENPFIERLNDLYDKLDVIDRLTIVGQNGATRVVDIHRFIDEFIKLLRTTYIKIGFNNDSSRRIQKLYGHLCRFNKILNIHELRKWWEDLDITQIQKLNLEIAYVNNGGYTNPESTFTLYTDGFLFYIQWRLPTIRSLDELFYENTVDELRVSHFDPISDFLLYAYQNYIYDMYMIDTFTFNQTNYNSKPYYASATVTTSQFVPPLSSETPNYVLLFYIESSQSGNNWVIDDFVPVADYCCFDDTPITSLSFTIYNESGTSLGTLSVDLTFKKVGSSAGSDENLNMIPSVSLTPIMFDNDHESMSIENDNVVSEVYNDMNFELLFGNKYFQLQHDTEYVLDPITYEEHVQQILRVPNKLINSIILSDTAGKSNARMFFKPSQILHLPIDEYGMMESVYGKCFVGQTIFLATDDGLSVFPAKVTTIDHSVAHGFIEAEVDSYNAKWFSTTDPQVIDKYLSSTIECHVIDDNIANFYKEYSNSEYFNRYEITDGPVGYDASQSMLGDPLYVMTNSEYVYDRLNYFFNEDIPNRFVDDDKKTWKFVYLGEYVKPLTVSDTPVIKIDLINRSIHDIDDSELYPILRDEPNDHYIWEKELVEFENTINNTIKPMIDECNTNIEGLKRALPHAAPGWEREQILRRIESYNNKIVRLKDRIEQIKHYGVQQECETTWQNVQSYDAALVYMSNGRAETLPRLIIDKRDVTMSQDMEIYLYDWTNKKWITPNTYTVAYDVVTTSIDAKAAYSTRNIVKRMKITPIIPSDWDNIGNILVYIAFNKSDVYDSLSLNTNSCQVQFKPIISTAKPPLPQNVYGNIRIRKHFDGHEVYYFNEFNAQDHEFEGNGFYIKRNQINGRDIDNPVLRVCDMTLTNPNASTYEGNQLRLYVKMPFGTTQPVISYITPTYTTRIHLGIDNFVSDEKIKLIAISNNNKSQYNGTISSVMFEAITGYDEENDRQLLTIVHSTLPDYINGEFICTVFRSNDYQSYGGMITVSITSNENPIMTNNGRWVEIPSDDSLYKELPNEFIIVPPDADTYNPDEVTLTIENKYASTVGNVQDGVNPLQFYYNEALHLRYPFSDIKSNDHTTRLNIDMTINPDIHTAKMTYLGLARYSSISIPENGFFDVTGYIPTPLSRDRFEWWVNGRQIEDDNIVILSPTSFQLKNLTSLKNFELIELVDDINDSEVMIQGNVYTDINGNTYGSYHLALESNKLIVDQSVRYLFNTSNHTKIQDYTRSIDNNPNNRDIESDILETIITPEPDPEDPEVVKYNELDNKPTINGVTVYNMRSTDLGLIEIPTDQLQEMYDEVWKKEIMTNPLFYTSHKRSLKNDDVLTLHSQAGDSFGYPDSLIVYASGIVDKSFSLYISRTENGRINSIANTVKIIPYVRTGVYIIIEKKYKSMWLHCTESDTTPIRI